MIKNIITLTLLLSLMACSGENDTSATQAKDESMNITTQTGIMLSNGVITNSFAYNELVDAYKNYIFQGGDLHTKMVDGGYLMEINKKDEMTNNNVNIKILFKNHKSENQNYLLASRLHIDGKEGNSAEIMSVVRDLPAKVCMSKPEISYCKEFR